MNHKTYEEFLKSLSEEHRRYYTSMSRGYYDKEKYKRTAAADIKHAAQIKEHTPPALKRIKK
jgi:hypothetical protein